MPKAKTPARKRKPAVKKRRQIVSASDVTQAITAVPPYIDQRIADIIAIHAPETNISNQTFCTAGCKGPWPCATMRVIEPS